MFHYDISNASIFEQAITHIINKRLSVEIIFDCGSTLSIKDGSEKPLYYSCELDKELNDIPVVKKRSKVVQIVSEEPITFERKLFVIENCELDIALNQTPFFKFLLENRDNTDLVTSCRIEDKKKFLASIGYEREFHKLSEDTVKVLNYGHAHFFFLKCHNRLELQDESATESE